MGDTFGSGLDFGGAGAASAGEGNPMSGGPTFIGGADVPPPITQPVPVPDTAVAMTPGGAGEAPKDEGFGSNLKTLFKGPNYTRPAPDATPLDQAADLLAQRVNRANQVATNPLLQLFNPEGVQAARDFVPKAAEALQTIKKQKAEMAANRQQAENLGLAPGEVADEATMADRVEAARTKALKGDLRVFKGIQAVDPKTAEVIAPQVYEVVAGHLSKAQLAYDSLAGMQNQGQYAAKLEQLRRDGTLTDLEALGLKVPPTFDGFGAVKAGAGQALREARIASEGTRTSLEARMTYQPMEEKEAKTYNGRLTTAYGDQITNGSWSTNAAAGTRGLVVNGAADPRDLGKNFTLATPEQRKAIKEEFDGAVPKEDVEKYRAFNRTYQLATTDAKGNPIADGKINTNPNVQQGVAEGLASMLRGGSGGANVGLLKIELAKRGWAQGAIDGLVSNYAGALNTLFDSANKKDYQSLNTQRQIRDVMDVLKTYNDQSIGDRVGKIAERAGALGLDSNALGLGGKETAGGVADAMERGRQAQIDRMMPNHQVISGGDGVLQLAAQRPGANAVQPPPGAAASTTVLPGAQPVATPVQQAQNPPAPGPQQPPPTAPGAPPAAPNPTAPNPTGGPAGSGPAGGAPQPVTIAGQSVTAPVPPGASPSFAPALQRIESGRSKDPWTATSGNGPDGKPLSSASGAFQMLDSTWNDNKPAGAPARAKDATPAQQTEAFATLVAKNAAALQASKLPVNDTTLYVAHNLGATGATKLLQADPNADARTVVGETAARNNPMFFKGKPTVAKALERYTAEMNKTPEPDGPKPQPGSGGATAEAPGLMTRISRMLSQGVAGDGAAKDKAVADVGNAAVEHAPAIGSTAGAVVAGIPGGAAGGSAGQMLKDYLQGRSQNPVEIAKQGALGGVLGVASEARPVLAAAGRVMGAGTVEGGAEAAKGGDAGEIADATGKGMAAGAGGELFGRALGMAGHKIWSMFSSESKTAVRDAAKTYASATEVLDKEAPTIPGVGGAKATPNPAYLKADAEKLEAERVLKDAGLKPEEAAYAHKAVAEGVPKQEAEAARPGAVEKQAVGEGYQQLENEVGARGVGNVKPAPKLPDGPIAAVESKQVSARHEELAERVEMAITAPAKNWQEKWTQLKDARSDLLQAERDALSSTAPGRTKIAEDMRTLADTVRKQQEKAAKYVFGEKDGQAFMQRLTVLDTRYRRLMDATNGGDLSRAAAMKGEAGREAEKKFVAFAHDDPQAIAAYRAMRGVKGDVSEATVPWTVAAEGIPGIGKVVKVAKLGTLLKEWARERAAGSPVKFSDLVKTNEGAAGVGQAVRDLTGSAGARLAVQ